VGRLPGTEVFRNVRRFQVQTLPQVMAVRIDESLLFTNSRWLAETLESQAAARPGLRHLVLMMSGVNDIDFSGLDSLHQLDRTLGARGIRLHLSEVKGPLRDRLGARPGARWAAWAVVGRLRVEALDRSCAVCGSGFPGGRGRSSTPPAPWPAQP
jgi:SulP family sulfate permease